MNSISVDTFRGLLLFVSYILSFYFILFYLSEAEIAVVPEGFRFSFQVSSFILIFDENVFIFYFAVCLFCFSHKVFHV